MRSNPMTPGAAFLQDGKMINMGGRPVIAPKAKPRVIQNVRQRNLGVKLALAFVAIYLIWGSTYLGIRYAVETIPPLVAAGLRHAIAGVLMFGWAWMRGFRPTRAQWIAGFTQGALFFLLGHGLLHWAEKSVDSGMAALLIATEPMFILLLAWMLGQQKISRLSALGLGLGVVGVAWLTGAALSKRFGSPRDCGCAGEFPGLVGGCGRWSATAPSVRPTRPHCIADALRSGHAAGCGRLLRRNSADSLVERFSQLALRPGLPDRLRIAHRVHRLRLAVATSTARAGGHSHVCESGGCNSARLVAGARTAELAHGGSIGRDFGSDRPHSARRTNFTTNEAGNREQMRLGRSCICVENLACLRGFQ